MAIESMKEAIKTNKKRFGFRPNEKVMHIIPEHRDGVKTIWWVSKDFSRKDQGITFADSKDNEVSAYLYIEAV